LPGERTEAGMSETLQQTAPARPAPRPRPVHDLAAAIGFLTLLPIGRTWPDGETPRSTGWYPWIGWLLGGSAVSVIYLAYAWKGRWPAGGAMLTGALVVAAWALLTRFLHWDGLADTFDGIWGGSTPEGRLEIMRDSRIGSFGAAAMVMVAVVQIAAVADLVSVGLLWPIVAAPVLGRLAAAVAAWDLPAARTEGLGLTVVGRSGTYERLVGALGLLALLTFVPLGVPPRTLLMVTAAGVFAALSIPRALAKPVGGVTGDIFGATVLLVETVVLLVAAVLA
jgi:adenosylcobinamide-GDP ribazoletransferase